ncbi:MAG TPA: cupredoxin family copper-binding protein [Burkholderiales bacterium]|nr:cupredoxin family copper-binding protein [Burkholderiales bacterium]
MSVRARISSITVAALLLYAGSFASAAAATHTITMDAMGYSPETLHVKRGDTVVWVNKDPFPHTATAVDRSFDSREIASGKRWSYVAKTAGKHPYGCTFHPTMKATLIVE